MWDDLPADVRYGVRRVVVHEAGRFVDVTPPHGMKRDTKAEENAWNSRIFSAAVLLMPNDARRKAWEQAFVRWAISSYMRPSDAHCRQLVDGKPVADWFTGACIFDDYTCENHGFVHPGYMGCIGLTLSCHTDFRLTGRITPRAVAWNASGVYENLKMAQVAAMRPDRIVSPDQRSLIGGVYIAGEQRPPTPNVSAVDVDVKDDRFTAKLSVDHGPSIRANLVFRTDPNGTLYVREELVAIKDVAVTRVATGMIGVLNNKQWIHETGHRTLTLDEESAVISAHSGKTLAGEANHIMIDDAMTIASDTPMCVCYVASSGPERGRATDRLYLNYADGKKTWKAGETISRYGVAIRVGGNGDDLPHPGNQRNNEGVIGKSRYLSYSDVTPNTLKEPIP